MRNRLWISRSLMSSGKPDTNSVFTSSSAAAIAKPPSLPSRRKTKQKIEGRRRQQTNRFVKRNMHTLQCEAPPSSNPNQNHLRRGSRASNCSSKSLWLSRNRQLSYKRSNLLSLSLNSGFFSGTMTLLICEFLVFNILILVSFRFLNSSFLIWNNDFLWSVIPHFQHSELTFKYPWL